MNRNGSSDHIWTRRLLLQTGAIVGTGLVTGEMFGTTPAVAASGDGFAFVHLTDAHIQPELGATRGVHKAFDTVKHLSGNDKPAFALVGGDLVMDATKVDRPRADLVYGLWQEAAHGLALPTHYSVGNHDVYLTGGSDHLPTTDPAYGKATWMKRLGLERSYGSFDYQGWRFITLDSLQVLDGGGWEGVIDDAQMQWLDNLLRGTDKTMPLVFLTHIPVMTVFGMYTAGTTTALDPTMVVKNGKAFKEMTQPYNVKAVFQGHTHVLEECLYAGVRYITGGAICGDWWKGKRLGVDPEGFIVARATGQGKDAQLSWRYVAYGWDATAEAKSA